ncbi:MAG: hypothetical protein ACQEP1_04575 [Nanobdellota archaeon]
METDNIESETLDENVDQLYNNIFENATVNDLKSSKELTGKKLDSIAEGYKETDFVKFDFEKEDGQIMNYKEIDTGLLPRIISSVLNIDKDLQKRYNETIKKRHTEDIDLTTKVIENSQMNLRKSGEKFDRVMDNIKENMGKLSEKRRTYQEKFAQCEALQEKASKEIESYREKLGMIKKDLEKAATDTEYSKYTPQLEKEKNEMIEKIRDYRNKMEKSVYAMENFNQMINSLSNKENHMDKVYEKIGKERMKIEYVDEFFKIARENKQISDDISNYNVDDLDSKSIVEESTEMINKIMSYNDSVFDEFKKMGEKSEVSINNLYNSQENVEDNFRKYDIEGIKSKADKLISERREQEYKRLNNLI